MNFQIQLAVRTLNSGGVISNPTDTIQGLTCLPYKKSIQKMLQLKRRNYAKGLILLANELHFFKPYLEDESVLTQIKPQDSPTTYLLKAGKNTSKLITGNFNTVAVRLTNNALISDLCKKCNSALLSSSANIADKPNINSILALNVHFKGQLDFIIAPKNNNNHASQIINMQTGERLRY